MYTYIDSAQTNSSGNYSFTIPSTVPTTGGNMVSVALSACGVYYIRGYIYTGANMNYSVNVCVPPTPTYQLGGAVWKDTIFSSHAIVYVVGITAINPTTGDTTIAAVDSMLTDNSGLFAKSYLSLPTAWPNSLRLKAALLPTDLGYANFLPSYYNDTLGFYTSRPESTYVATLRWSNAKPLTSAEVRGAANLIRLIPGSNPGGPGFIGGSVLMGANKGTAVGDPLSSRMLILTKANGQAVAYTYSDASGHFRFSNIPLGTYSVFGDALGKSNPGLTLTLTSSLSNISNVWFEENSKSFVGHVGNLSTGGQNKLSGISVFPNPATDLIRIQGLSSIQGEKTAVLLDMKGATIIRQALTKDMAEISVATMPAGVYLLQIYTAEGSSTYRIVK
jgi:hypothetical protein